MTFKSAFDENDKIQGTPGIYFSVNKVDSNATTLDKEKELTWTQLDIDLGVRQMTSSGQTVLLLSNDGKVQSTT